jgi:hypothetical protein
MRLLQGAEFKILRVGKLIGFNYRRFQKS